MSNNRKRSQQNKNLTLTTKNNFMGRPIQTSHGALCIPYLSTIYNTIEMALASYPRLMAIRVDLKFPKLKSKKEWGNVIQLFMRSLQSQIDCSARRRERQGYQVHSCTVRYVWVKERSTSLADHYHLLLLFNKDRFNWTGTTKDKKNSLGSFIVDAWARVVGVDYSEANGLVYFSKDGDSIAIHRLNNHSNSFDDDFNKLFKHVSYLAKEKTKHYGEGGRCFGASSR
ncbi:MAG: inovirus Gp2 family protein [Marinomonas sp.]